MSSRPAVSVVSPSISIVVVNWNGFRWLPACLKSLRAQIHLPHEIFVVDNGSTDESRTWLNTQPGVTTIINSTNVGYCGGANRGIVRASGEWILLLNHDVILDPNYLSHLATYAEAMPQVGLMSGLLLENELIDSAGQFLSRTLRPRERGYHQRLENCAEAGEEGYIFSVCGAVAFYRRTMLRDITEAETNGPLDESFFAYSEDLDIGWRAQRKRWKAYYVPYAIAHHQRGAAFQKSEVSDRRKSQGYPRGVWGSQKSEYRFGKLFEKPEWLQAHIILNRYAVLIKHCPWTLWLNQSPWILPFDLATLAIVLLHPSLWKHLWQNRSVWSLAWRYRFRYGPAQDLPYSSWIT